MASSSNQNGVSRELRPGWRLGYPRAFATDSLRIGHELDLQNPPSKIDWYLGDNWRAVNEQRIKAYETDVVLKSLASPFCPQCYVGGGIPLGPDHPEIHEAMKLNQDVFVCAYNTPSPKKQRVLVASLLDPKCYPLTESGKVASANPAVDDACAQDPGKTLTLQYERFYCPLFVYPSLAMDYAGFRETLFFRRKVPEANCTAVLVGPNAALTARHCVAAENDKDAKIIFNDTYFLMADGPAKSNSALLGDVYKCLEEDKKDCTAVVAKIGDENSIIGFPFDASVPVAPVPDIVLVHVKYSTPLPAGTIPATLKSIEAYPNGELTEVGWGISEKTTLGAGSSYVPSMTGGQPAFTSESKRGLMANNLQGRVQLDYANGSESLRSCKMDSGSPVFNGRYRGKETQSKELIGLVSAGGGPTYYADGCKTSTWQAIQFITPQVKNIICDKAKANDPQLWVNGC